MMRKRVAIRSWEYAILAVGISICLLGAFFMGWGEAILGENHTGIATILGIVGIGLLARSSKERRARRVAV